MGSRRILFAGSPLFACPYLEALVNASHQVVAVLTQPDRPSGRGQRLQPTPVKSVATRLALPILQPDTLKTAAIAETLRQLRPEVAVVVAYGMIIPSSLLSLPALGWINVHASLLPRWRGAAPIEHAILAADQETGITIMQIARGVDTGPMFIQARCAITPEESTQSLTQKLSQLGIDPLLQTIAQLPEKRPEPQPSTGITEAPKLTKQEAQLQWQLPAIELARKVRSLSAHFFHPSAQMTIKVIEAHACPTLHTPHPPGQIIERSARGVVIQTGEGALCIELLQLPNKKPLDCRAHQNAYPDLFFEGATL